LRLEPGAHIHEHTDIGDGWEMGRVRLHVPIVTDERVDFFVDGRRVVMRPGELWYCDFTRPHRVHNRSDVGRVHMVLDLVVDEWLRGVFPAEPLLERARGAWRRAAFFGPRRAKEIAHAIGALQLVKRASTSPRTAGH
jgi:hypothetical protein